MPKQKKFSLVNNEELILAVEQFPALYDPSLKSYRNKQLRRNIWERISRLVGADVSSCETRWRSLRDTYNKKKSIKKPSGSGACNTVNKLWEYYSALSFLDKVGNRTDDETTYSNFKTCSGEEMNKTVSSLTFPSSQSVIFTIPSVTPPENPKEKNKPVPSLSFPSSQPMIFTIPPVTPPENSKEKNKPVPSLSCSQPLIVTIPSGTLPEDPCFSGSPDNNTSDNAGETEHINDTENFEESELSSNIDSTPRCMDQSLSETPNTSGKKGRRKDTLEDAIHSVLMKEECEAEKFGSFISSQIKIFNERDKLEAYRRISDIIFDIKSKYCH